MSEKFDKSYDYFRKMSGLKKALIVFTLLLIFIVIVEQPGSEASKREKSYKFLIPKLVIEEVKSIQLSSGDGRQVVLEKKDGKWRIANGKYFPADASKAEEFLKSLHSLKQTALVSKNPSRMDIYFVDEKNGSHIQVMNSKDRKIADFFVGRFLADGQFLRKAGYEEVYQTTPALSPFLTEGIDGWKDKTLLSIDENEVSGITLKSPDAELDLKKAVSGEWHITQTEGSKADSLAIRTLFEQLKDFKAESFAESVDGSQADFSQPDYKISIIFTDGSSKTVLFSAPEEQDKYFARNGDANFIYIVSKDLLDKIFGLKFKTE